MKGLFPLASIILSTLPIFGCGSDDDDPITGDCDNCNVEHCQFEDTCIEYVANASRSHCLNLGGREGDSAACNRTAAVGYCSRLQDGALDINDELVLFDIYFDADVYDLEEAESICLSGNVGSGGTWEQITSEGDVEEETPLEAASIEVSNTPANFENNSGFATIEIEVVDSEGALVSDDNSTEVTFTPDGSAPRISAVTTGTGDGAFATNTAETVTVSGGKAAITVEAYYVEDFSITITNNASLTNPASINLSSTDPGPISMESCLLNDNSLCRDYFGAGWSGNNQTDNCPSATGAWHSTNSCATRVGGGGNGVCQVNLLEFNEYADTSYETGDDLCQARLICIAVSGVWTGPACL